LTALTPNSIACRDDLERQLDEIRRVGYARSQAESDDGVGSVAVAVLDGNGTARAAISVSAPLVRIAPESESQWIEAIRDAAAKLKDRLWGGPSLRKPADHSTRNERTSIKRKRAKTTC